MARAPIYVPRPDTRLAFWQWRPVRFRLPGFTVAPSFFTDADTFFSPVLSLTLFTNLTVNVNNIFTPKVSILAKGAYQILKNEVRRTTFLARKK